MRGEVIRLRSPRESNGLAQSGPRFAVVVQSDHLALSTWLVAPTLTSALAASFRPRGGTAGPTDASACRTDTRDRSPTTGKVAGRLTNEEMRRVDAALRLVLGLIRTYVGAWGP